MYTRSQLKKLTKNELEEYEELLEQELLETVSPKLEAFRNPVIGGFCDPKYKIKIARGGRGAGAKCLAIGTKVLMYDGTLKKIEDIKVNDLVMGTNSEPRKVLDTTKGFSHLWKIKQDHAQDYIVNDNHVLTLNKAPWCKKDRGAFKNGHYKRPLGSYHLYDDVLDISIQDYIKKSNRWKSAFYGIKSKTIQYKEIKTFVDPYVFGAWLGDGSKDRFDITTMDDEILEAFRRFAFKLGLKENKHSKENNRASTYIYTGGHGKGQIINSFVRYIKEKNLYKNKHIPHEYMVNSEENRLQLLAGLIDTDGTKSKRVGYVFGQKNYELSKQVKQVADSLGFKTSINKQYTTCNGKRFLSYRVYIGGNIWRIPSKLKRKQIPISERILNIDPLTTSIKLEDAGIGEYAGISIDGNHRFLLEDSTITHNSHSTVSLIVQRAQVEPIDVICLREIQGSIDESVKKLIEDKIEFLRYSGWKILTSSIEGPDINGKRSHFIFKGLKDLRASTNVKGLEGYNIAFVEEAATISMESWNLLLPTIMRTPGAELWAAFNPDLEDDPITVKIWDRHRDDALCIELKPGAEDNPWWNAGLQKEMEEDFKADEIEADHIWNGNPRTQGDRNAVSSFDVQNAMDRILPDTDSMMPLIVGCDVARGGKDRTVIVVRRGLKVLDIVIGRKWTGDKVANECRKAGEFNPTTVYNIDVTGVGSGPVDILSKMYNEKHVNGINFGSKSDKPDKYTSKADDMWFNIADLIKEIDIPFNPELKSELTSRQYYFDTKGRRKIESKDEYKKRRHVSPDLADALLLCYYGNQGGEVSTSIQDGMRARRGL